MNTTCEWFALCDHDAIGVTPHPILGDVPICQRCADKLDIPIGVLGDD